MEELAAPLAHSYVYRYWCYAFLKIASRSLVKRALSKNLVRMSDWLHSVLTCSKRNSFVLSLSRMKCHRSAMCFVRPRDERLRTRGHICIDSGGPGYRWRSANCLRGHNNRGGRAHLISTGHHDTRRSAYKLHRRGSRRRGTRRGPGLRLAPGDWGSNIGGRGTIQIEEEETLTRGTKGDHDV